ncbi:hypothetical protein COT94_01975 [Candidatus Falkowbacteria bacterium CG10_big_fil_rev_8_21_14_0_10_37_14]|uniref:Uncharacterized protein n=1 Tax=Candidatus Falkowbacteria bacterium CG10_big_fil_rev_8_21_14_0_10_37_14 TaxID=1974561 RepID=A0A2M6WTE0_9BACT|nr:hypothetical protein [Candidatus Falkowbacteria bacterium]PIT96011.1 MAG: hypothetical protein COT94_01975 [Candidatus Falkowbacteria bacterium CG10_big_fil_rev_8_21_14_0_10_37_14]
MSLNKENTKIFPKALPLKQLIGPSFLILALGLGSGEIILWPYLVANYGLGIAWGALLGISFQYFINMEIERYALVKGESVFVGLRRLFPWAPAWFIISTFIGFGLPGMAAASAQIVAKLLGWGDFKLLAIAFLILIGLILSVGKSVYQRMEKITQVIILIGVPFIMLIAILVVKWSDVGALMNGLVGRGDGYFGLPAGIGLATFLAAFAYSGAGGNLNLTQSIYIKEKGYGMGKYAGKMGGLFHSVDRANRSVKLSGQAFAQTPENLANFKQWWKRVSLEHAIVFWLTGFLTICLLMLVAYATAFGLSGNAKGIMFVLNEGLFISNNLLPIFGSAFLLALGVMLFQTQLGVCDSTSRIMSENMAVLDMNNKGEVKADLSKIYFIFVWLQVSFGSLLFFLNYYEPKTLLILGAVINAVAMFVHIGLVYRLNIKTLPIDYRPARWRRVLIIGIFIFFGVFSAITLKTEAINYWENTVKLMITGK